MARESDRKIENSVDTPHTDNYSPNYIAESVNGYDDDMDGDYHGRQKNWSSSPSTGGVDFTASSADDCGYCGNCHY